MLYRTPGWICALKCLTCIGIVITILIGSFLLYDSIDIFDHSIDIFDLWALFGFIVVLAAICVFFVLFPLLALKSAVYFCNFTPECIEFGEFGKVKATVDYSEIKWIRITGPKGKGRRDGKYVAVIEGYFTPFRVQHMSPEGRRGGRLSYSINSVYCKEYKHFIYFFEPETFPELMKHTNAEVYVAETILALRGNDILEACRGFEDRVSVALFATEGQGYELRGYDIVPLRDVKFEQLSGWKAIKYWFTLH